MRACIQSPRPPKKVGGGALSKMSPRMECGPPGCLEGSLEGRSKASFREGVWVFQGGETHDWVIHGALSKKYSCNDQVSWELFAWRRTCWT